MGADIDQVRSVAVLVQPAANLGLRLDPAARALPRARTRSSSSGTESSQTRRWRRESRANPSLEGVNSLLAGN
jgi:hypothetical protein